MTRKVLRGSLAIVLIGLMPLLMGVVALSTLIFLPLPATLPTPKPALESQSTRVFDSAGNEIAVFKKSDTSIPVQPQDIPQVLKDAVVSAEDRSFYEHGGVDVRATLRALWRDINNQAVVEGGSTITQQYVKLAFTGGERTFSRKIREAILASQLDRQVDKDTILYRYLSTVFFGEGNYGIGAAAQSYFRKPVSQLTLSEAAALVGVIPAPTRLSLRANIVEAEAGRKRVLGLMLQSGRIDQAAYDEAINLPLWPATAPDPGVPFTAVQPPDNANLGSEPWFANYVHQWLEDHLPACKGSADGCPLIDTGGLKVITTLDPAMQAAARDEAAKSWDSDDDDLDVQSAVVSVEPPTGFVKAMVGGRDYSYSQINSATTPHQPGSAFKPFILATAFEQGIQPTKVYSGAPLQIGSFTMKNFGGAVYGNLDLRTATWKSVNAVYGRLILDVGVDKAMAMANKLGAPMPAFDPNVYGASVALGAIEVSPLDMASAFGVFANHGKRAEPTPVLQVIAPDGKVLLDNTNAAATAQQVIDPVVADNVTDVLKGVIEQGTAAGRGIDRPAAGKTGTTDDAANAMFVGYTPTLSTAIWYGHLSCGASTPEKPCRLLNVAGTSGLAQGGSLPAPLWQRYMKRALADVPITEFTQPAPIQSYADTAKRASRQGFDPGPRKNPTGAPSSGGYVREVPPPDPEAPTTTTIPPSTTTTAKPPPGPSTTTTSPPLIN